MAENRALTVAEASRQLGISPQSCKKLIESGRLTAYAIFTGKQKRYRVRRADLEAFLAKAARVASGFESVDGKTSYL